jgi:hypothetical protein
MTDKIKTPALDTLIASSKQLTTDLMSLRHELQRALASRGSERQLRTAKDRLSLALNNTHDLSRDLFAFWETLHERGKATVEATGPALGNGRLQLTKGGR